MSLAPVVFSAVPTLFGASGELDPDANRALYKLVAGLVDGLFVAGTTGEFPALEDAERLALFEMALAEAGPDRVIAHIGAPDARHASRGPRRRPHSAPNASPRSRPTTCRPAPMSWPPTTGASAMPLPAPSCMPIFFPNGPGCPFPRRYLPRWRRRRGWPAPRSAIRRG